MNKFLKNIIKKTKNSQTRIVFPEGTDIRILKATRQIQKKKIANIILLGNRTKIKKIAEKNKIRINLKKIKIIDPTSSKLQEELSRKLFELRKNKGLTLKKAKELIQDVNYFGTMMVKTEMAEGMVSGATHSTAKTVKPALQIIKTKEKFHKISGVYFMTLETKTLLFADTAIIIDPNIKDLTDITIDTAKTAKKFGLKPKVALLSFSTKGSAKHPKIEKIQKVVKAVKKRCPKLIIDGELQVDSALVPKVSKIKCPKSPIKGDANILIFPDLASANIAYKLVERLAKAKAIGPILQGLKKPINDLSRGCNTQDIINTTAFTVYQHLTTNKNG